MNHKFGPLPALRAPLALPRAQRCENCKWSFSNGQNLECRRNPPGVSFIPGPGGQPMTIAGFAPVQPTLWCGEWHVKIEGMQ